MTPPTTPRPTNNDVMGKLEKIEDKLDRMDLMLRGNGDGQTKGLIERLRDIEDQHEDEEKQKDKRSEFTSRVWLMLIGELIAQAATLIAIITHLLHTAH